MPLFLINKDNMVTSIEYTSHQVPDGYLGKHYIGDMIQPDTTLLQTKSAVLMCDVNEGRLYYEYIDRPLTQEEKLKSMQFENADLMFQNAMQDMAIEQLQVDNAELMLMVANSQLGGI